MSKAVLISIKPKWCGKIFSGTKNLEFRKRKPNISLPFKCYVYCTTGKDTLSDIIRDGDEIYGDTYHGKTIFIKYDRDCPAMLMGRKKTVIGEMTIDRIEEVTVRYENGPEAFYGDDSFWYLPSGYLLSGGLTLGEFEKYKGKGKVYGWHIADYKLYKEPKTIGDFAMICPPQSYCYVNELDGD